MEWASTTSRIAVASSSKPTRMGKPVLKASLTAKLRVQVLAPGFQTFGEDYDINQPTMEITIKLKRPEGQYSIYGNQQNDPKDNKPPPPIRI